MTSGPGDYVWLASDQAFADFLAKQDPLKVGAERRARILAAQKRRPRLPPPRFAATVDRPNPLEGK